ncbi:MAG TPA: FAD-dependent oxidoreductase [Gemmatimonadales bacterium]|nr:FAD-dependent oxidoreductase [Gemmatimonadales bacterium]
MTSADVVVLGAGVMGASAAWHLARRGVRNVLLLDAAATAGAGSTGRATGGFRAQYATAINVRLSLLSREKLKAFADDTGVDPGYAQHGYLWLARTDRELALLAEARRVQHEAGLSEARGVTPDEIRELNPALAAEGIVGGAFCQTDGYLLPLNILEGYLAGARSMGAEVRWGVRVTGLEVSQGGRVTAVRAGGERIGCGAVINALGPWAATIMETTGFVLPVSPLRRQIAATVPTTLLPATTPMTIFAGDGFHFRVRDGRVLLLWPTPGVSGRPYDASVDPGWVSQVTAMAHARVPCLRAIPIDPDACWAGLYEISPDKHAILGPTPGAPNLYLINGSSGHGVMHAPALGQLLAEIVCDGRASTLDAAPLAPERFADGRMNPVSELL